MKFAVLAASALALSAPAFAQDATMTPPPAGQDTMQTQDTTQDPAMQNPPATQAPMPMTGDPAMQTQSTMGQQGGQMTQGGYAPSAPPMSGMAQPGAQVVFRPSMPVAQAFPPPPPRDNYPVCSRTVRDGCRNPGGQ